MPIRLVWDQSLPNTVAKAEILGVEVTSEILQRVNGSILKALRTCDS